MRNASVSTYIICISVMVLLIAGLISPVCADWTRPAGDHYGRLFSSINYIYNGNTNNGVGIYAYTFSSYQDFPYVHFGVEFESVWAVNGMRWFNAMNQTNRCTAFKVWALTRGGDKNNEADWGEVAIELNAVLGWNEVMFTSIETRNVRVLPTGALYSNSSMQVNDMGFDVTIVDNAPFVSVGSDQVVDISAPATLTGSVTDDGLPNGTLSCLWSNVSGPGTVTFADATNEDTTATFSMIGTYVLRLMGDDGESTTSADMTITVNTYFPPEAWSQPAGTVEGSTTSSDTAYRLYDGDTNSYSLWGLSTSMKTNFPYGHFGIVFDEPVQLSSLRWKNRLSTYNSVISYKVWVLPLNGDPDAEEDWVEVVPEKDAFRSWNEDSIEPIDARQIRVIYTELWYNAYLYEIEFVAAPLTCQVINASSIGNGTIKPNGLTYVLPGNDETFNFYTNRFGRIENVTVDGISVGVPTSYAFTNVQADHSIEVEYHDTLNDYASILDMTTNKHIGNGYSNTFTFTVGDLVEPGTELVALQVFYQVFAIAAVPYWYTTDVTVFGDDGSLIAFDRDGYYSDNTEEYNAIGNWHEQMFVDLDVQAGDTMSVAVKPYFGPVTFSKV